MCRWQARFCTRRARRTRTLDCADVGLTTRRTRVYTSDASWRRETYRTYGLHRDATKRQSDKWKPGESRTKLPRREGLLGVVLNHGAQNLDCESAQNLGAQSAHIVDTTHAQRTCVFCAIGSPAKTWATGLPLASRIRPSCDPAKAVFVSTLHRLYAPPRVVPTHLQQQHQGRWRR